MHRKINYLFFQGHGFAVSGSSGYLGSSLISDFGRLAGEMRDIVDIPAGTAIVHLAANLSPSSIEEASTNVRMDFDLFSNCQNMGHRLIYASSNNVYPRAADLTIENRQLATDWYSWEKICAEQLLSMPIWSFPRKILRIADVFGVNQRHGNFFRAIETSFLNQTSFNFSRKVNKVRSYIYIDELVNILKFLIFTDKSNELSIFNVCHSTPYTLEEIVEFLKTSNLKVKYLEGAKEINDVRTMRQSEIPGYKYKMDLPEALAHYSSKIQSGEK